MSYIVPIHSPTSVHHAVKLNLLDEEDECLVLAKSNWLEIWRQTPTGLILDEHKRFQIHGKITMLQKVSHGLDKPSRLLVGTANRQYFTLSWNPETHQLETEQTFEDVSEPSMRESQTLNRCLVDPTGEFYCLVLYEGALSFIRQKSSKRHEWTLDAPEQMRISEMDVKASTFVHSNDGPRLAILNQYGRDKSLELAVYKVWDGKVYSMFEKTDRESTLKIEDAGVRHLIPVLPAEESGGKRRHVSRNHSGSSARKRPMRGGVIAVGETTLTYFDTENKSSEVFALQEPNIFVAWTALDDFRFFLGDEFGGLHLLSVITDGNEVTNLEVVKLGQISQPMTMIILDDDQLFVGSHVGDSQVVKLSFPKNRVPTMEVIQTFNNIGPILDFSIMDLGLSGTEVGSTTRAHEFSSGQARIVAGCGAYESGSLQSIRSGVRLEDYGSLGDFDNVKSIFSLHAAKVNVGGSIVDDTLVISSFTGTRVFRIDNAGEISEVPEFMRFPMDEQTLLASNVTGGILHISTTTVRLIDPESGMVTSMWGDSTNPKHQITAASANEDFALVCVGGTQLVTLDLRDGLNARNFEFKKGTQIACVHVPASVGAPVAFVTFWTSSTITVLNLETLEKAQTGTIEMTDAAAVPRSITMAQLLPKEMSGPTLLVAMSNGVVVNFDVDPQTFALSNRTSIALGTQQASLTLIPTSDPSIQNVFATCELSTLIHNSGDSLKYSAVDALDATVVCPLNAIYYPHTIVIASPTEVKISVLDNERVTQVSKLHLGETVRRVAHSARERIFGVGAIRRGIKDGVEWIKSEFRLVDEMAFQVLGKPLKLGYKESGEMVETVIAAQFATNYGEPQERFVVGTSFLGSTEGKNGRLMVIGVDSKKSPYLIAQQLLKGSCNRVGVVDGKIVAALTKTVTIWDYEEMSNTTGELKMVASLRTPTTPIDLVVNGNHIAITDLMKSVCMLEYKRGQKGLNPTITEIAKDWDNRWGTAVGHLHGETYVGADGSGNLKVLKLYDKGKVLPYEELEREDNTRLLPKGEYHLGENVTCIRSFEVKAKEDAIVIPRAFLATSEGSVYVMCTISEDHREPLLLLQQKILEHLETLGKRVTWEAYRAFTPTPGTPAEKFREAAENFVDGEIMEAFLKMDERAQGKVARDVVMARPDVWKGVEDIRRMVEGLQRIR